MQTHEGLLSSQHLHKTVTPHSNMQKYFTNKVQVHDQILIIPCSENLYIKNQLLTILQTQDIDIDSQIQINNNDYEKVLVYL